jgi:hypothetical protein
MFRLWVLLTLLLAALVACGNPTAAPTTTVPTTAAPTQPTTPPIIAPSPTAVAAEPAPGGPMSKDLNVIKTGVQKTLDKFLEAMNKGDEQALLAQVDVENLSFKRAMSDWIKSPVYTWKGRNPKGAVSQVKIVKEPYVKVWLKETVRGEHVWVFKWTEQGWLLSEPDEEELGPQKNKETDKFIFRYYEWDEAFVESMVKAINTAHAAAIKATGRQPLEKYLVRMSPTFQTRAGRSALGVAATYNSSAKMLSIMSPESFVGTFSSANRSEDVPDIQHELTHLLVHEATYPKAPYLWLNEAMAYYFTNDLRPANVKASLAKKIFTLKELNQLRNDDTSNEQLDRDIQAQATIVVQYIVEKFGGREKAWQWMIEETQIRDFDASLKKVLGVSVAEFEKGWQEFMLQKYR